MESKKNKRKHRYILTEQPEVEQTANEKKKLKNQHDKFKFPFFQIHLLLLNLVGCRSESENSSRPLYLAISLERTRLIQYSSNL